MFVEGEPQTLLSAGEKRWRAILANRGIQPWPDLRLRFVVGAWKRRGHFFDLDNLVSPVLDAIGSKLSERESIWATVELGDKPGVEITNGSPPPSPIGGLRVVLKNPPLRSIRTSKPLLELVEANLFGEPSQPCGCEIRIGMNASGIAFGFEGPIKPTIDALWPLLGGTFKSPADHRVRDLRL
ncbi:MAG: hypothetical protein KF828_04155 [Anaerolineales bacterium]|nr:hypothetical protein [Anaerolineales bacterium]